jgi:hypothetical protein
MDSTENAPRWRVEAHDNAWGGWRTPPGARTDYTEEEAVEAARLLNLQSSVFKYRARPTPGKARP